MELSQILRERYAVRKYADTPVTPEQLQAVLQLCAEHGIEPVIMGHGSNLLVLDGGKIREDGTYDELIAKGGYFAELVERQRLDLGND